MSRYRAWTFTINNETYDDLYGLVCVPFRYLCFGFETSKSGTPHIQGYIYMHEAKTLKRMKKHIPRAHLEASRGTAAQNQVYTSKDEDWYEIGEPPEQGKAKWDQIVDVMNDPPSNPHLYNQYNKMYRQLTLSKKKDHQRKLWLCCNDYKFICAKHLELEGKSVSFLGSDYDNEDALFTIPFQKDPFIEAWIHGFPPKHKVGYEYIVQDPEYVIIVYDGFKEFNMLKKKYIHNIDGIFEQELLKQKQNQELETKPWHRLKDRSDSEESTSYIDSESED